MTLEAAFQSSLYLREISKHMHASQQKLEMNAHLDVHNVPIHFPVKE